MNKFEKMAQIEADRLDTFSEYIASLCFKTEKHAKRYNEIVEYCYLTVIGSY